MDDSFACSRTQKLFIFPCFQPHMDCARWLPLGLDHHLVIQAQVSYLTNYTFQLRTDVVSSYGDLMADPALRGVHKAQGKQIAHLILINNRRSGPKQMSTQYDTEKTFCGKAMPNFVLWESGHCHH